MVFGTRVLKYWVLGPSGYDLLDTQWPMIMGYRIMGYFGVECYGLRSMDYGLLWGRLAYRFGQLGFRGGEKNGDRHQVRAPFEGALTRDQGSFGRWPLRGVQVSTLYTYAT